MYVPKIRTPGTKIEVLKHLFIGKMKKFSEGNNNVHFDITLLVCISDSD
jgi:hypothetical protein